MGVIREFASTKFRAEWYKSYCDFEGYSPDFYDIASFDLYLIPFIEYLIRNGCERRQELFTYFIRSYPAATLNWLVNNEVVPSFYKRFSEGGDYVLCSLSKEEPETVTPWAEGVLAIEVFLNR